MLHRITFEPQYTGGDTTRSKSLRQASTQLCVEGIKVVVILSSLQHLLYRLIAYGTFPAIRCHSSIHAWTECLHLLVSATNNASEDQTTKHQPKLNPSIVDKLTPHLVYATSIHPHSASLPLTHSLLIRPSTCTAHTDSSTLHVQPEDKPDYRLVTGMHTPKSVHDEIHGHKLGSCTHVYGLARSRTWSLQTMHRCKRHSTRVTNYLIRESYTSE